MSGKGDKQRPVNKKKFDKNFDTIFGIKIPWWSRAKKRIKKLKKTFKKL